VVAPSDEHGPGKRDQVDRPEERQNGEVELVVVVEVAGVWVDGRQNVEWNGSEQHHRVRGR